MLFIDIILFATFPILSMLSRMQYSLIDYKNKYSIIYVFMISMGLAIIAYYIVLPRGTDIYGYYDIMETMKYMSYEDSYKYFDDFSIMPIIYSIFYIVSQIGSLNLISSISVFTVYSITFYIVYDYSKLISSRRFYLAISLVLTFLLTNFITVVSGIRFHMAYSIFLIGIYNETIKDRSRIYSLIIYICSCLIHTSMYYMLVVRIAYEIYSRTKRKHEKIYICLVILLWKLLNQPLINIFNSITGGRMARYIDGKLDVYSTVYSLGNINSKIILYIQNGIFILFVLILGKTIIKKYDKNIEKYWKFLIVFAIFLIGCIGDDILFNRYGQIFRIMCIPGLSLYFNKCNYKVKPLIMYFTLIYVMINLYLQQSLFKLQFSIPLIEMLTKSILNIF